MTRDPPHPPADAVTGYDANPDEPTPDEQGTAPTTAGETIPTPALSATPARWSDHTRAQIRDALGRAPADYRVRVFVVTATGGVLETLVTRPASVAMDAPRVPGRAEDGSQTARDHAAVYEVVFDPSADPLDEAGLDAIATAVRDAHAEYMSRLAASAAGVPAGRGTAEQHPRYVAAIHGPHTDRTPPGPDA